MRNVLFLLTAFTCHAASMLTDAEEISRELGEKVANPIQKTPWSSASVWLQIQSELTEFSSLKEESLWDSLRQIGIEGVYFLGMKAPKRTSISADFRWEALSGFLRKKGMSLIGDTLGKSTGIGADFFLALKNEGEHRGIYKLVEIAKEDWHLLPRADQTMSVNIPWVFLKKLKEKGYLSETGSPYRKEGLWNATKPIRGTDGNIRRWIYLKEADQTPSIDWMNPTFASYRIASADMLDSVHNLGQSFIQMEEPSLPILAPLATKLGVFSVDAHPKDMHANTDLSRDVWSQKPLLKALQTANADELKATYLKILKEKYEAKRLVHTLPPFRESTHKMATFFYAMQPGVFCLTAQDLLGASAQTFLNLAEPNENTAYASISGQLNNRKSYASYLRNLLRIRRELNIAEGTLLAIAETPPSLFVLLFQLKEHSKKILLAVNFGQEPLRQKLEMAWAENSSAIDAMTGLLETKPLGSSTLDLQIEPQSCRVILLQQRRYD